MDRYYIIVKYAEESMLIIGLRIDIPQLRRATKTGTVDVALFEGLTLILRRCKDGDDDIMATYSKFTYLIEYCRSSLSA